MTNNEKTQSKMQLSSIKKMQELMQNNAINSLTANVKKARMHLEKLKDVVSQKQQSIVKTNVVEPKIQPKVESVVEIKKETEPRKVGSSFDARNQSRQTQQSGFANRNNNFGQKANGFNRDVNKRNFNQKPGGFGQKSNGEFGSKPTGFNQKQNGQRPINSSKSGSFVTADKIDASTLVKQNSSHAQKKKSFDKPLDDKKSMNKKALVMRGYVDDDSLFDDGERMGSKKRGGKKQKETQVIVAPKIDHAVITTDNLTVKVLAEKIGRPVAEIMGKFLLLGMMVNINSNIDYDSAELIASELGVTLERKVEKSYEEKLADIHNAESDDEKSLKKRPPVVTVMGHVDHGKTSLLDYIRKTNVISGEAGGITQHIGAYQIQVNGEAVTFIDTPGHAAFDAMRKRGANLTDVAILVVAADDGVMPQTKESIKFIKEANVPMLVAINKIDVTGANVAKVKEQLAAEGVMPEEWGGDTIMVPISAKHGQNVDQLLEMVLFVAEYQNLRANPDRNASGSIIEARLDKGMGTVATVLVQNGTLKIGDTVVAGTATGKIRAMINEKGVHVKKAGPSTPVAIL